MSNIQEINELEAKAKHYRSLANKVSQDKAAKSGQIEQLNKQKQEILDAIKAEGLDPDNLPSEESKLKEKLENCFTHLDSIMPDQFGNFPQQVDPTSGDHPDIHLDTTEDALNSIPD